MDQFNDQTIILVRSVREIQPAHIYSGPEHLPEDFIGGAGGSYRRNNLGFGILISYHTGIFKLEAAILINYARITTNFYDF
jgi:hypothetical protein